MDNKISSQPEADLIGPDVAISRWLVSALVFALAWFALGWYAVHHPDVQRHLTRFVPRSMEQQISFRILVAWLALPLRPTILAVIASILVWVAFLRAEWSDRMLFSAAAILSSTVLLGGSEYIFYLIFGRWYGSTMVCAGVITYTMCLLLSHRAKNGVLAILSLCAIVYALTLPYYAEYDSMLDVIGGMLFAGAVLCASFFIAERAGVRPFAEQLAD
jgi:hypothetical protein